MQSMGRGDDSHEGPETVAAQPDSAAVDTVVKMTTPTLPEQVYIRRAFRELQWGDTAGAAARLDSACIELLSTLEPDSTGSTRLDTDRVLAGTRVIVELYHDLVQEAAPIPSASPLGRLLSSLPDAVQDSLTHHPYYRELHLRHLAGMADVPIDLTPEVRQSIDFFTTSARDIFARWLDRSSDYHELIQTELEAAGLPSDLFYMAMIESGFNPRAYSVAHAAGIWQFTSHTGRLYGLRRNTWKDERRDPIKSTQAAVRHIRHLYDLFQDWRLVVAAYNCGQGRLGRTIRRSGTHDFWELEGLPRETARHVPRFMAAAVMAKDPEWFGFDPPESRSMFEHDVVEVRECVDLRVAAECAGTTYERMRALNPELRRGYTPPVKGQVYALRVPPGRAEHFKDRYASLPVEQRVRMVDYRVRSGDTVSHIARRMGVSSRVVMDANRIRNPRHLRAGALLQIPLHPDLLARYTASSVEATPDPFTSVRSTYRVRRGDTLWEIAQREGVKPEQIRRWNNLPSAAYIYPGDRLTIWRPGDGETRSSDEAQAASYRVRRGDTLSEIALRMGVTTSELRRWNNLRRNQHIHPGDRLTIWRDGDRGTLLAANGGYYTVRRGDTLWDIARAFRASVSDLKQWNGIRNASRIRANQRLRVMPPGTVD